MASFKPNYRSDSVTSPVSILSCCSRIQILLILFVFISISIPTANAVAGTSLVSTKKSRNAETHLPKPKIPSSERSSSSNFNYKPRRDRYSAQLTTSVEKPPVSSTFLKKKFQSNYNIRVDQQRGITATTFSPQDKEKKTTSLTKFQNVFKIFRNFKFDNFQTALKKISNGVMGVTSGDGVSTGRYWGGFMDGAMVPMSFLMMAAFIMDILQRLFPLPYASFVHQAQHRTDRHTTPAPPPMPPPEPELDKFQLNTPLGNIDFQTNEDYHQKFHKLMKHHKHHH